MCMGCIQVEYEAAQRQAHNAALAEQRQVNDAARAREEAEMAAQQESRPVRTKHAQSTLPSDCATHCCACFACGGYPEIHADTGAEDRFSQILRFW